MSIFDGKRDQSRSVKNRPSHLAELPVALIVPNPDQPRQSFDETSIDELAASIESVGLIQPLIVQRQGDVYELIAGERRLRAVRSLGWRHVRCIVRGDLERGDPALMAVIENLQREDLNYFEEAECFEQLLKRRSVTQEELGSLLGKSQSYIANKLRLLKLEPSMRKEISAAGLSERHARELLRLPTDELRRTALGRIRAEGLSVKESEREISKLLKGDTPAGKARPRMIRIFRDYRLFINTVNSACEQLRESGLCVDVEQRDLENGVDITIRVMHR